MPKDWVLDKPGLTLGSRGALSYVSKNGKRVYLKQYQKKQCLLEASLGGDVKGVCKLVKVQTRGLPEGAIPDYGGLFYTAPPPPSPKK